MVETNGIEPHSAALLRDERFIGWHPTLRLPVCSSGGGERDRTDDLRLAKPSLSQLSYAPGSGGPIHGPIDGCVCDTAAWWAWLDSN